MYLDTDTDTCEKTYLDTDTDTQIKMYIDIYTQILQKYFRYT
jgi:hypothetical protein